MAFVVLCVRNLDPIVYPTLYAEDGSWTGKMLSNGFFDTAFGARSFPILGFMLFYALGNAIAGLLFDDPAFYLPAVYYILSNLFMAGIAVVAFARTRTMLSFWAVLAILIAVVLLPVGIDGNEIYGRVLNLGFFFPYLQILLLIPLMAPKCTRGQIAAALIVSLICGLTFPVGMGVCVVASGVLFLRYFLAGKAERDGGLAIALFCVGVLPLLALSRDAFTSQGGADLPFKASSFIEFAVARSALYLFLFAFYKHLNDIAVLLIAAVVLVVGAAGMWRAYRNAEFSKHCSDGFGYVLVLLWGSAAVYLLAMIGMRSGLTSAFDHYTGTYPDRYFTGLNLAVFTALIFSVGRFKKGWIVSLVLAAPFIATGSQRIELDKPATKFGSVRPWTTELCGADVPTSAQGFSVPIPPEGWSALMPRSAKTNALASQCRVSNFYELPFVEDMRPSVTVQEGGAGGPGAVKVGALKVNNAVELIPVGRGKVKILVTGADPGVVLELAKPSALRGADARIYLTVSAEVPSTLQLFYLKSQEVNYSEPSSLYFHVPAGKDEFVVVLDRTINPNKFRLDLPEGVGKAYLLSFDPAS
ncbi:hypothetical protein [uncultured Xanthomonas sp.]|uniref:hypothetical protein n=1 Tax=uncultured Xanthomonas sp. TaxID=152831 RepID=UPI0025FD656A|nr:hypothetical protein [uncultured Xanthomonas sp.]